MRRLSWLLVALWPAACGPLPPPVDSARLPPGLFGTLDQDMAAVLYAQVAFASAARTYGNPAEGALAALALEYEAGALNTSPRWAYVPAITQLQLLQARIEMRAAAGIAPGAPSQAVVDALAGAIKALRNGDAAAAMAALRSPAFTGTPEATLRKLANLPYLQVANVATARAAEAITTDDDRGESSR